MMFLCSIVVAETARPRVAVFPLAGSASEQERERAGFSLRTKLDRQGVYQPIDGPTMLQLAGDKKIDLNTSAQTVMELSKAEAPDLIIWGEYNKTLQLHVLNLRTREKKQDEFVYEIKQPADLRFAVEKLIESLPGSKTFEHISEESVTRDEQAEKLWKEGPNLLNDGAFDTPGDWQGMLKAEKYPLKVVNQLPEVDQIVIRKEGKEQYLAMNLSRAVAETNGLACLSGKIEIKPQTRYRIGFRYRSNGPVIKPFVKGYVIQDGVEREIYRRQVPNQNDQSGQWVEVLDDLNPQHPSFPVQFLRIDLYIFLTPGEVSLDDVVIKEVGKQTRQAKDDALDPPVK